MRRFGSHFSVLAGISFACAPKTPPDPMLAPRLPSPVAGSYARVPDTPADPVIAALVAKHSWDASLSGAAAGVALAAVAGTGGLERWEVREFAWRAGWPYPVDIIRGWSTSQGATAPAPLVLWLEALDPKADLGLVRARNAQGDAWVALTSRPRVDLGVVPRTFPGGATFVIPAVPGGRYAVADPDGRLWEGTLDVAHPVPLIASGEWLFEVADKLGVVATFPLYVACRPPEHALISAPPAGQPIPDQVEALLHEAREAFGLNPWRRDPLLDSGARALLGGRTDAASLAESVGFSPSRATLWSCTGATVQTCLDSLLFDPRHRPDLLAPTTHFGLATDSVREGELAISLLFASG